MALDILEWGVIAVMGVSILIWGPEKVPDIAKTLGRAKKEFDGATKQLQGITKELQTGINSGNFDIDSLSNALLNAGGAVGGIPGNLTTEEVANASAGTAYIGPNGVPTTSPQSAPKKSADQMLIEMAKSLRIDTKGKTREEVSQAIMERVSTPQPEPAKLVDAPQTASADAPQAVTAEAPQTASADAPPTGPGEAQAAVTVQQEEVKTDLSAVD
jgi:sec-independent protein translocase protein TatA